MFKGFQNNRRSNGFNGFPNLNFQMNNEAYGFKGCTFWLDAAYGLNTQTDLAAITTWKDKIRNIEFRQATAGNQPRFIASSVLYNNYPVIECQDANRFLDIVSGVIPIEQSPTLITICNYDALVSNANVILGTSGSGNCIFMGGNNASITGIGKSSSTVFQLMTTVETTSAKIVVWTSSNIYVNGISEASGSQLFNEPYNRLFWSRNSGESLNGKCAEIIGFNYKMSDNDIVEITTRINSKYAIY